MGQFLITKRYKESVEGIFHGCEFSASVSPNPARTGYRNTRVLRMAVYKKGQTKTIPNLIYHWNQKDLLVNTHKLSVKEINEFVRYLNALD